MGSPHQHPQVRKLCTAIVAMFHHRDQLTGPVQPQSPSSDRTYADAAEQARDEALAAHFNSLVEQLMEEVALDAVARLSDQEHIDALLASYNIDSSAQKAVAHYITAVLDGPRCPVCHVGIEGPDHAGNQGHLFRCPHHPDHLIENRR